MPIEDEGNDDKWFREAITFTDGITKIKTLVLSDGKPKN